MLSIVFFEHIHMQSRHIFEVMNKQENNSSQKIITLQGFFMLQNSETWHCNRFFMKQNSETWHYYNCHYGATQRQFYTGGAK